jgi:hypothetical protein
VISKKLEAVFMKRVKLLNLVADRNRYTNIMGQSPSEANSGSAGHEI